MMLILSLFPSFGLLDRAFEEVWPESCIVRAPDKLWGGDIKSFHAPAGKFDAIIGVPLPMGRAVAKAIREALS